MALPHAIRYVTFMTDQEISRKITSLKRPTLKDLEQYRFDPNKKIQEPAPTLSLNGVTLCTPGNISNIQGQAKSAKSSVLGAAMAAMLRALTGKAEENPIETLLFTSSLPANIDKNRKFILHFDTEQSSYHHQKLAMDILTRSGIEKKEEKEDPKLPFYSYSLICIDLIYRQSIIEEKIEELEKMGDSIACLVLDGVADTISNPNDEKESNHVVAWLHALAESKQCVVLTILHENPGDAAKARGHLGSQIQRKSETNLRVKKQEPSDGSKTGVNKVVSAVSCVWVERARGAHIPEKDAVKISWCNKKQRHLLHDRPQEAPKTNATSQEPSTEAKLTKREAELKAWLEQQLKSPMHHTPLKAMVARKTRCKPRTAITRIGDWIEKGWIHKLYPEMKQTPYGFGPAPEEKIKSPRAAKKQEAETIPKKNAAKKPKSSEKLAGNDQSKPLPKRKSAAKATIPR